MMDEGPADLRELLRLPDFLVVCSSTGWTDEKHMLYVQLLEETFVSQLHGGECSFKELSNHSPRYCRRAKSSKRIVQYAKPDQGCPGIVGADNKSCIKVELMDSTSCGNQQDGKVHSMDDNASTTERVEESTSQARAACSGQSSTCYVGKRRHSPSRSAEGSDQNFDEETKGAGESRRGCSQKRLKSSDITRDDQVVPSVMAGSQEVGGLMASGDNKDKCGPSKMDA
ncbi:hypothetical protein U9M48_015892 [Paspalum notatum var. saurae]|uniref:Uncharacterized protein n=1 Tax=Paspalum notatum var. saurae TaxID=547442 RepID=A0AAQ3WM96_PASNO